MTEEEELLRGLGQQEPQLREPVDGVFTDLWGAKPSPPEWVIENLIPPGLIMIGAPPKCGKSMLTLAMAALVEGLECEVLPPSLSKVKETGCVFVLSAEMSVDELQYSMIHGLHVQGQPDESLLVIDDVFGWQLDDPDAVAKMLSWMERRQPKLVIIDPLRNFHKLDERDSSIVHLFTPLRNWAKKNKSAIVCVHHTTKPTEDTKHYNAHHLRGSGGLFGVADGILMITPLDPLQFGRWSINATFKRSKPWEREIQLQMWDRTGPAEEEPMGDIEKHLYSRMADDSSTTLVQIRRTIKLPHDKVMSAIEALVRCKKIRRTDTGWEKIQHE